MANSLLTKNDPLLNTLLNNWPQHFTASTKICIGLSGGVDSVVLLHLFNQLRAHKDFNLSALHVNHNISPNALSWQNFCEKLCANLAIPLHSANVKVVKVGGEGLENSARQLRYAEFKRCNADLVVLAHHQDDQIETMLSQLLRGSNIHNIAAMREYSSKAGQNYWRPLLNFTKLQLINYSQAHNLSYINDESNADNHYLRNFLRNKIIPQLIDFDEQVITKLARSLTTIQDAAALNDTLAKLDYQNCKDDAYGLSLAKLTELDKLRQLNLLAYFIKQHNLALPSHAQLDEFARQITNARRDRTPKLSLTSQHTILCHSNTIHITTLPL